MMRLIFLCALGPLALATPSITSCATADECARRALLRDGAVAIRTPGLAAAREAALAAAAACTSSSAAAEIKLPDGSSRRSLGARTVNGVASPLDDCDGLADATAALRALVDGSTNKLLHALQPLQSGPSALLAAGGRSYASLSAVARDGEQLEHFHAYRPPADASYTSSAFESAASPPPPSLPAVPLHTDAGLFIAIVPALHLRYSSQTGEYIPIKDANGRRDGFYVQTWEGLEARVDPLDESQSVVFVIGDGWAQWLNPSMTSPLRPAPHGMVMRHDNNDDGIVRVWYGRMYLPPPDAVQHPTGLPFGAWRQHHASHPSDAFSNASSTLVEASDHLPSGCGGGRRYLQTTGVPNCLANEVWCWHQCIDVSNLPCTTSAVCWRTLDDSIWQPEDPHCASCETRCLAPPPPPSSGSSPSTSPAALIADDEPFCTGIGTDMHMSGFAFHKTDCIILLFHGWKLDSPLAFTLGCLGTFALGILTELLTWGRRHIIASSKRLRRKPGAYRAAMGLAFTVQVTLGYFLMLLAMTYQAEIFIAVCAGLGVGHVLFNVMSPVAESTDACCVEAVCAPPEGRTAAPGRTSSLGIAIGSSRESKGGEGNGEASSVAASAAATEIVLLVQPITCQTCVDRATAALVALEGVKRVHVDADGSARLTLGEEGTEDLAQRAVEAIEKLGKTATIEEGGNGKV